jgi:hypothetical protein
MHKDIKQIILTTLKIIIKPMVKNNNNKLRDVKIIIKNTNEAKIIIN